MWKSIAVDDLIRVSFKAHFQEAYLDKEKLKQTTGESGYGAQKMYNMGK